jgi:hypothetical protein
LKPFNTLPKDKIVFFGTDAEETYSGTEGTPVPCFRCIWVPSANMDIFKEWYNICYSRIAQKRGGDQIRGDAKWDWIQLTDKFSKNNILNYLSEFRMINDYLDIVSGEVIDLALEVDVIMDKNQNQTEVLRDIISRITAYFAIDKRKMGDPLFVGELMSEITNVSSSSA